MVSARIPVRLMGSHVRVPLGYQDQQGRLGRRDYRGYQEHRDYQDQQGRWGQQGRQGQKDHRGYREHRDYREHREHQMIVAIAVAVATQQPPQLRQQLPRQTVDARGLQ